ncbi:MAG: DedA family protein [Candidatus Eisenbacteria sp.]|nr:DedA family protein [Candidatus Eisenbacteria bacterium]
MAELLQRFVSPEALAAAQHLLDIYGAWVVLGLGLVVGVWQPLAPDYFILAAALVGRSPYPMAAVAVLGTTGGAVIGYLLGRTVGTAVLARAFRSRPRTRERIERLFNRYGVFAVTICAATPVPMKYALWMSGTLRLSMSRYLLAFFAGYVPRVFVVAFVSHWASALCCQAFLSYTSVRELCIIQAGF